MKPTSLAHLKIINTAYADSKFSQYLKARDGIKSFYLKSIICTALRRVADDNGGYVMYRVIFNYQAMNRNILNEEDVFAIIHVNNQGQTRVVKRGIA